MVNGYTHTVDGNRKCVVTMTVYVDILQLTKKIFPMTVPLKAALAVAARLLPNRSLARMKALHCRLFPKFARKTRCEIVTLGPYTGMSNTRKVLLAVERAVGYL